MNDKVIKKVELNDYIPIQRVLRDEVIYLFDGDLNKEGKVSTFDKISFEHFKNTSLTHYEICKCNLLIFSSHKHRNHKILKSRYF